MDVQENFETWKQFLGSHVDDAQAMGWSDTAITNIAAKIGDYLAGNVSPKTVEDQLLKQMWDIASPQEKTTLAHIVVQLADRAH